jgi:redox-sensing transcriptional repressor
LEIERHIPVTAISRLSQYYRTLLEQEAEGYISSGELAKLSGLNSAIVRRDLSYFGRFGVPGRGYSVAELKNKLFCILGIDRQWRIALVGLGNLGRALLRYKGFRDRGFNIVSVFDRDPGKIGKKASGMEIKSPERMKEAVKEHGINMAIVAVPSDSAAEALNRIVEAGICAVLNFAPSKVEASEKVTIVNIDIGIELEKLSFLSQK